MKYNDATYIYRKDVQGNIIALLDSSGGIVVKYTYDALATMRLKPWIIMTEKFSSKMWILIKRSMPTMQNISNLQI